MIEGRDVAGQEESSAEGYCLAKTHMEELAQAEDTITFLKVKHSEALQCQNKKANKKHKTVIKKVKQMLAIEQSWWYNLEWYLTKTIVVCEDKIKV